MCSVMTRTVGPDTKLRRMQNKPVMTMLMRGLSLLFLSGFLLASPIPVPDQPSHVSQLYLPMDLYTGEGVRIEKGSYNLELHFEKGHHSLVFLRGERIIAVVNGLPHQKQASQTWVVPVVGTLFFRPTAIPIGTDEERHYSKTGQAQYEYEPRDWKATMRVFQSVDSGNKEILFVLQKTGETGEPTRNNFLLFLDKD